MEKFDREQIKRLIDGDYRVFDEIYQKYNTKVYSFSFKNLKNKEDAEGVVQDVFMNLWKDREKLKGVNNLDAWVFSICFNTIRKRFRRLAKERNHLKNIEFLNLIEDKSTQSDLEYNDLLNIAEKIIDTLPKRQKEIFIMSKMKGFSNDEISEELKISKKTVENHLSKARNFIKGAFENQNLFYLLFFWLFLK